MLQLRVDRILSTNFVKNYRSLVTKALENQEEYTRLPVYPPIRDTSKKARKEENVKLYHEAVKNLSTVEEKLIKLNMPKYYGYKCIMLNDKKLPYNCLPLSQYSTRTHFQEAKLPELYKGNDEKCSALVQSVKSDIEETLAFEMTGRKKNRHGLEDTERDRQNTSSMISQLNRTILSALSADNPHLAQVEIDLDPRHEAFWFVGGIEPLTIVQKIRKGQKWQKEHAKDPIDRPFQYIGTPYMALRHKLPLPPMQYVNLDEENYQTDNIDIPTFKYDPRTLGYTTDYRHGVSCPGFWPGSPHEFGLLSYQSRDHFKHRSALYGNSEIDWQEALHAQAIQSSFAWTFAQACYQGFSTYNDVTYPITTQTVITDGQTWSFYVYQLNTTLLHSNNVDENSRYNMCWGSKELKLFESVDKETGKLNGLNEDVLKQLIHFYINQPVASNRNMKPYLGEYEQTAADISDDKRREFLETRYKHLVSNRPRHRLTPEIYSWEKIYKVDHNTKPLAPKRRFFELGINPYDRRLDDHSPVYIPKAKRSEGPRSRKMWEKAYYP